MPKMKTHRGAARRFKVTGTGKFTRRKGNISHNKRPRITSGNVASTLVSKFLLEEVSHPYIFSGSGGLSPKKIIFNPDKMRNRPNPWRIQSKRLIAAAPRPIMTPRMISAPRMPQNNTRC